MEIFIFKGRNNGSSFIHISPSIRERARKKYFEMISQFRFMNKMMAIKILNLSNEMDVDEADVCMMAT